MKKYSLILFDMDDTLFDFKKSEREAFDDTFNFFNRPDISKQHSVFKKINMTLWKELEKGKISPEKLRIKRFEDFLKEIKANLPPDEVSLKYISFLKEKAYLVNNAEEIIKKLHNDDISMVIITNGISDVQHSRLNRTEILHFMKGVFISEEIGYSKPHPLYFSKVLKNFPHIKKDKVLVVGDSLSSDITGAYTCGLDSVWINPKSKTNDVGIKPTYEIKDLKELLSII